MSSPSKHTHLIPANVVSCFTFFIQVLLS